jgi:hypothetical protein
MSDDWPLFIEAKRTALRERGVEFCPWCDGIGLYARDRTYRVACPYCEASGEAARRQGPAADDWRARVARCGAKPEE